jgi:sulfite exporter TauE/SafE
MAWLWAAFGLGILGSLHCAGMCGPIALALPFNREHIGLHLTGNVFYQLGRIFTYAFIGLLFGTIGRGFSLAGIQQPLSIAVGALMIGAILVPRIINLHRSPGFLQRGINWLKAQMGNYLKRRGLGALFVTGLLNGFLPCGLVYMALIGALGIGSPLESAGFMTFFGLGTFPMMFAIALTGNFISVKWRSIFNRAVPYVVVMLGLVFILRGMGLGIKFLSPPDKALQVEQTEQCH